MLRVEPKIVAVAKALQDAYSNPADGRMYATGEWAEFVSGSERPSNAAQRGEAQPDGSITVVVVARDSAVFDTAVGLLRSAAPEKNFERVSANIVGIGALQIRRYDCVLEALDDYDTLCSLPGGGTYRREPDKEVEITVRVRQANGKIDEYKEKVQPWDSAASIGETVRSLSRNKGATRIELIDPTGGGVCYVDTLPAEAAADATDDNPPKSEGEAEAPPKTQFRMLKVRRSWDPKSGVSLNAFQDAAPRSVFYTDKVGSDIDSLAIAAAKTLPLTEGARTDGLLVVEDEHGYRVRVVKPIVPPVPEPVKTAEREFTVYYLSKYDPINFKVELPVTATGPGTEKERATVREAALKALDSAGRVIYADQVPDEKAQVGFVCEVSSTPPWLHGFHLQRKPGDNGKRPFQGKVYGYPFSVVLYAATPDEARRLIRDAIPGFNWDVLQYRDTESGAMYSVNVTKSPATSDQVKFIGRIHDDTRTVTLGAHASRPEIIAKLRSLYAPGLSKGTLCIKASGPNSAGFSGDFTTV